MSDKPSQHPTVVMSGMRSTGSLHLGHYLGVLRNWTTLQTQHSCFFMAADWHALTTQYEDPSQIQSNSSEMVLDWLASGVSPEQSVIYRQSRIPEIAELHLLLSMLTPNKWVETDPTLKDLLQDGDLNYGLLGYPILQTADVLVMRGSHVPVGKDQVAHLEISRDIVTRFNHLYGADFFAPPKPMLTDTPMMPGLDGRKMSKSYNNAILLKDTAEETAKRLKSAVTDPKRIKRDDPGVPEDCVAVYPLYKLFTDDATQTQVANECRAGSRGCMDCKMQLAEGLNANLTELRQRRSEFEKTPNTVEEILETGEEKARDVASKTLLAVRKAMKFA